MLPSGVYPASVTPLLGGEALDFVSLARLLAFFEAAGCAGVVLAGTNGEGPSLAAVEKRDLIRKARRMAGNLKLLLGIATPSIAEAKWSLEQAARAGADAALVMPPSYFRGVGQDALHDWFAALLELRFLPIVVYNYPQMTGLRLEPPLVARLARHEMFGGLKDSSGETGNLAAYRAVVPEGKLLVVGNETLLLEALAHGWSGTISGAANLVAANLVEVARAWEAGERQLADTRFRVVLPAIEAIRAAPQPASNKAVLAQVGVLADGTPRLPLTAAEPLQLIDEIEKNIGFLARRARLKTV